jgi:hypothetical protein
VITAGLDGPQFVICVVLLLIVMFYVLFMCKCVLPPGVNPIAVDKYININHITQFATVSHYFPPSSPASHSQTPSAHFLIVRYQVPHPCKPYAKLQFCNYDSVSLADFEPKARVMMLNKSIATTLNLCNTTVGCVISAWT